MASEDLGVASMGLAGCAVKPSGITREQFLRGVAAIRAYEDFQSRVCALYREEGLQRVDSLGGDKILAELQRQLEERCNDPRGRHGSMIEYMLYEPVPEHWVALGNGKRFVIDTPEQLWDYWRQTGEGPFSSGALKASQTRPENASEGGSTSRRTTPESLSKGEV